MPQYTPKIFFVALLFSYLMACSPLLRAGNVEAIDSLETLIENAPDDTLKAYRMYQLSRQYDYFNSTERITWMVSSLNLSRSIGYANGVNQASTSLINILFHRNINDLALRYCHEYMGWLTEVNDTIRLQSTYNVYANLLSRQDKSEEAFVYYNKSLDYNTRVGNNLQRAQTLNNLSILMGDNEKYDSALYYADQAISILRRLNDVSALSNAILGKAEIMLSLNDTVASLSLAKEALEGYTIIGLALGISNAESVLGDVALRKRRPEEALAHFMRALEFISGVALHDQKKEICLRISECLGSLGRYEEAYQYQLQYKLYNDSASVESRKNKMIEIEVKYEIERKDAELQEKSTDLEQSRSQRNLALIGVASVLLLLGLSLWAFWTKKKSNVLLGEQKKLVEEKQRDILDSIHYAHRIQDALLTNDEILRENLPSYFVLHKPKDIVSGDFYWSCKNENGFYIAVCDSTGHGVPGAFMSLLNTTFLNEAIRERELIHTDEIFNYVRDRLVESISKEEQKDGFDGVLFRILPEEIEYSAAGNAPVSVNNQKHVKLAHDRFPVGKSDHRQSFSRFLVPKNTGDAFYIFTDGYADQFGGAKTSGKKFKYQQFYTTLESVYQLSPSRQREKLDAVFENWRGHHDQVDDVLVLGIMF